MDLTDICRKFQSMAEYIFILSTHSTFFRRDNMSGHKTSLKNLKKTEIIPNIFWNTMI